MPTIGGTTFFKRFKGEYDFAVDGGAISTITLRSNDGAIPNGSYIMGGLIEVDTLVGGGAASIAVQAEAAGDILAAAAISGVPWSTTGRKSVIPAFTGATSVKTTAERNPAIVISGATVTSGKFRVILYYQ